MKRIGPKMREFARFVHHNPGCTRYDWAKRNLYYGRMSRQFSYNAADRAIAAGLVKTTPGPRGSKLCFEVSHES